MSNQSDNKTSPSEITSLAIRIHSRRMADELLKPLSPPFQAMIDETGARRKAEWVALPWYIKACRKIRGAAIIRS